MIGRRGHRTWSVAYQRGIAALPGRPDVRARARGGGRPAYDGAMATDPGLDDALAALWVRSLPRVLGRIDVLDEAAAALGSGALDDDLRERARVEAHRLAGLLGTLGLPEASPVARRLEHLLAADPRPQDATALRDGARALRTAAEAGPTG